jgi:hypothetical protein
MLTMPGGLVDSVAEAAGTAARAAERSRLWVAIRHAGLPAEIRGQVLDALWPIFGEGS